jgi:predicted RNA-binding Zn-ribbon protein involved in translation (DUF1610 family)
MNIFKNKWKEINKSASTWYCPICGTIKAIPDMIQSNRIIADVGNIPLKLDMPFDEYKEMCTNCNSAMIRMSKLYE